MWHRLYRSPENRKSHQVVTQALDMLARMEHRGGQGCDPCSGDGAGILLQKPHEFLLEEAVKLGIKLPSFEKYGVGVVLFPKDEHKRAQCRDILERNAKRLDLDVIGYRVLPTNNSMLGADLSVPNHNLNTCSFLAARVCSLTS